MILLSTAGKNGGRCMPCKNGTRESMEQSKEIWRKEKEYDPHRALWHSLVDRAYKTTPYYQDFSPDERKYFFIGVLDGEVYNGGLHQFFGNSSGDFYRETLGYLQEIGALKTLELLEQGKQILFGDADVPADQDERNEVMQQFPDDDDAPEPQWSIDLDVVDEAYYENPDDLGEWMERFAESSGLLAPFLKEA